MYSIIKNLKVIILPLLLVLNYSFLKKVFLIFIKKSIKFSLTYFLPLSGGFLSNLVYYFIILSFVLYIIEAFSQKSILISRISIYSIFKQSIIFTLLSLFLYLDIFHGSSFSTTVLCMNPEDIVVITELDHFNALIKNRDNHIKLYEAASKLVKQHGKTEDKDLMIKYGKKLDELEKEIDKYKEKGYEDPADFYNSASDGEEN